MAKTYKRREPKKQPPRRSTHDKIFNHRRSTAEKVMIVLGVVIVLSMLLGLVASLSGTGF
jgi:cell division protein FtsL